MISLALERFVSIIHPLYKFQHRSDCDDDDDDDDDWLKIRSMEKKNFDNKWLFNEFVNFKQAGLRSNRTQEKFSELLFKGYSMLAMGHQPSVYQLVWPQLKPIWPLLYLQMDSLCPEVVPPRPRLHTDLHQPELFPTEDREEVCEESTDQHAVCKGFWRHCGLYWW